MSVITELASAPYFDDFSPEKINVTTGLPEVDRDFLRILFRPGYAVQARELNQAQAILQMQVERFGKHIFKEGSIVLGGQSTIDTQTARYLTIVDTFNSFPVVQDIALNKEIVGVTSGAKGLVVVTTPNSGSEPKTLIYKPTNGIAFLPGETINLEGNGFATLRSSTFVGNDSITYDAMGPSSTVSIDEGIFFTKGLFVICPKQTTYLAKYSRTPNVLAGLLSEVSIVTETNDETLLDNANGSYNFAAPGAHRLKIDLVLVPKELGFTEDAEKFILILEVREGKLYKQISRPTYNEIAKLLARRTFDESGDYTVKPFILNLQDYTDGATGAIAARISPGKAYVKGFEVETISTQTVDIPKARTTESYNNGDLAVTYSTYVLANLVAGIPDVSNLGTLYLFDNLSNGSSNIGRCNVRGVDLASSAPSYRLFLFDITITDPTKTFADVLALGSGTTWTSVSGTTNARQFVLLGGATGASVLFEPSSQPTVFDTGYGAVNSISDVNFTYTRNYNSQTLSSGITTIQTPVSTERFVGTAGSTLSETTRDRNYIVSVNDAVNNNYDPVRKFTISLDAPGSFSVQTATIDTTQEFNAATQVVDGPDDLIDLTDHGLRTGTAVIYDKNGGGNADIGLTSGSTYYIIRNNDNSISFASSFANAVAGTKLNISPGTGTQKIYLAGQINIVANINNNDGVANTKTEKKNEYTEGRFATSVVSSTTVVIPSWGSSVDDYYNGGLLTVVSGPNASDTTYTIADYNGTTKTITLTAPITVTTADYFQISPFFAAATSYTSSGRGIVYAKPTTLGSSIASTTTNTVTLSEGTIPNASVIKIGSEEMYVLSGGGTVNITVIRGYRGTTASTHSTPQNVSLITIGLNVPDVTRINKIITNTTNPVMADWFNPSKEITKDWILDNGQRDAYYDIASVTLRPNVTPYQTPIVVFFDYFQHGINDGFFSVNSYPDRNTPHYYTTSTGQRIDLYNAIDLRPSKTSPTTFVSSKTPIADSNFGYDITYFLPRIDKLTVTTDGVFKLVQGIPNINPRAPRNIDGALTLYELYIPPFTYIADSIRTKYIENKRYTMRDIGKLEKRLENLEYYTSLNALEKTTTLFEVRDSDGLDRFKNGILVDNFTGHNIGDPTNPDYKCSIDIAEKVMRPEFRQKAYSLSLAAGSTGFTQRGDLITKAFTDVLFINQPLASRSVNVNPFAVFAWNGNLTLTPNNDFWKDTRAVPSNVANLTGELDNITSGTSPFGTLFNQWNNMWFGTETQIVGFEEQFIPEQNISWWQTTTAQNTTGASVVGITQTNSTGESSTTTVTLDENQTSRALVQELQTRTIPATTVLNPITQTVTVPVPPPITLTTVNVGDTVTSVALSEYIRPRRISFSARGMKPNTVVYPFFDNISVSANVTPTGGTLGGTLTTNAVGEISGTFDIPFGRFFVGDRNFLLTDSSTGNRSQETTSAEARYTAQGIEETTTSLNIPLALPDPNSPFWREQLPPVPVDPLAETFFVDPTVFPEGVFISKVDLAFRTKDQNIPLTVQIRETVNGYPSSTILLGQVTLQASQISISEDASAVTSAVFPNVIYLAPGEYSIILLSNSNNYEAWIAQIGENVVGTNTLISEQPYVGSLFKSQNASTWTAEQTQDLWFKLYRCEFNTSNNPASVIFTDWDQNAPDNVVVTNTYRASVGATGFNSFSAVNSSLRTLTIPNHPYASGSLITYSGATGFIGITPGSYYTNRVNSDTVRLYYTQTDSLLGGATGLVPVTPDSSPGAIVNFSGGGRILYIPRIFLNSILPGSSISGTGIPGGAVVSDSNIFDNTVTLSADITQTIPAGAEITIRRKSEGAAKSDVVMVPAAFFNPFSSTNVTTFFRGATGVLESSWTTIVPNKNYNYTSQRSVNISSESFQKRLDISNTNSAVSPVINVSRQSVIQVENIINNDFTGESGVSGGNAWTRYITRTVKLLNDSTYVKLYLTANKPSGSNVLVYYKIKSSSDSDNIDNKNWTLMSQTSPSTAAFSPNPNEFIEYTFLPADSNTDVSSGSRKMIYESSGVTYEDFIEIKFKIVLTSQNSSFIPRVADFRAIVVE